MILYTTPVYAVPQSRLLLFVLQQDRTAAEIKSRRCDEQLDGQSRHIKVNLSAKNADAEDVLRAVPNQNLLCCRGPSCHTAWTV